MITLCFQRKLRPHSFISYVHLYVHINFYFNLLVGKHIRNRITFRQNMKIKNERCFAKILPLTVFSVFLIQLKKKKNAFYAFCISTTKSLRIKTDLNERRAYVNTTTFELEMEQFSFLLRYQRPVEKILQNAQASAQNENSASMELRTGKVGKILYFPGAREGRQKWTSVYSFKTFNTIECNH